MKARRAGLLAALAIISAASFVSARASHDSGWRDITFSYRVPCAFACAYWADSANTDLDGDGHPDVFFDPCVAPFPSTSYADRVVAAPFEADLLEFEIYPWVDWDSFICGAGGERLAGSGLLDEELCDNVFEQNSTIPFGCVERNRIRVRSGQSVILRVFNWSDPFPVTGRYRFTDLG